MTEKHDVTKSSNPDVQALLVVITGLAQRIETLQAEVFALAGEVASIPDQLVVPGPEGEAPQVVSRSALMGTAGEEGYTEGPVYAEAALYSSEAKPAAPIPESSISEDEKLAELVGDARGAMADYKEVLVDLDTAPGSALVKR